MKAQLVISALVATAAFSAPSTSHAGSNCTSGWNRLTTKAKGYFVCNALNTESEDAARTCLDQVEQYKETIQEMKATWNTGDSSSTKIGTRGLPHARTQTGNLKTERQFAGQLITGRKYTLTIDRTGGKAKKDMVVQVCMVDSNGDDVEYETRRINKSNTSTTIEFIGVEGTMPLIHLNNERWGANGHHYTIRGVESGQPAAVRRARKTLKAAKLRGKITKGIR